MTTQVDWNDGSGDKIYLTYGASEGTQTISVTSDPNGGASSRTRSVVFSGGGISRTLQVFQDAGAALVPKRIVVSAWVQNKYINQNNGNEVSYNGWSATPYLDISGAGVVAPCHNLGEALGMNIYRGFYNASYQYLGRGTDISGVGITPPSGAKYARFSYSGLNPKYFFVATDNAHIISPSLYAEDTYVERSQIISYTGWNTYKFDLSGIGSGLVGIASQTSTNYNSYFDSANQYLRSFAGGYNNNFSGADYALLSQRKNSPVLVYPVYLEETI